MVVRSRCLITTLTALALVASLGGYARPPAVAAADSPFTDIAGTTFEADIEWLWAEGITVGCSPTKFCPDAEVTRGQMASFLVRMFDLEDGWDIDAFTDDDGTTHEQDINRLAHAGLTEGCTATTFCPTNPVRRDEMASFLARAIPLTDGAGDDYFRDDDGTTHEANIDRAAAAGIASGCAIWKYCPAGSVTRGEMAAFLHRVETPLTSELPHPAPTGPQTLHVATTGTDTGNDCFSAGPCRTIRRAIHLSVDSDTIEIGPGTFREEGLVIDTEVTITGDPGGGTTIDAGGGQDVRVITTAAGHAVTLERLTISGGVADYGGAILGLGPLTIRDSVVRDSRATEMGGGIAARRTLRVERSIVTRNHARGFGGGIDSNSSDPVIVIGSLIADNTSEHHVGGLAAGTLYMQRSTVRGNTAGDSAGGLFAIVARINASTISGNAGRNGGGILIGNSTDPSAITNTTISGNTATLGGGILTEGRLTIRNATISGNVTSGAGAGVAVVAGTLDLINTIVAGNRAGTGGNISGSVASKLASIIGVPAGLTLADILSPAGLADNGGPTRTIALTDSARNPAIGKGNAATCAAAPVSGVDQRGEPRMPPCDIGAYEVQ